VNPAALYTGTSCSEEHGLQSGSLGALVAALNILSFKKPDFKTQTLD